MRRYVQWLIVGPIFLTFACSSNESADPREISAVPQQEISAVPLEEPGEVFFIVGKDGKLVPYPYVEWMTLSIACTTAAGLHIMTSDSTFRVVGTEPECLVSRDGRRLALIGSAYSSRRCRRTGAAIFLTVSHLDTFRIRPVLASCCRPERCRNTSAYLRKADIEIGMSAFPLTSSALRPT
jgi:hypothetical protein